MLKVFVLQKNFGAALIVASNQEEALKLLQSKEGSDEYLCFGVKAGDFEEVDLSVAGMAAYITS